MSASKRTGRGWTASGECWLLGSWPGTRTHPGSSAVSATRKVGMSERMVSVVRSAISTLVVELVWVESYWLEWLFWCVLCIIELLLVCTLAVVGVKRDFTSQRVSAAPSWSQ